MPIDFGQFDRSGRFTGIYRRVSAKPGWVWRGTLAVGILLFVAPLLLLAMAALLAMGLTYMVLSLIAELGNLLTGRESNRDRDDQPDGRENVRVIRPEDESP